MNRSDLALAALASAAVPGMKPVAVARMSVDEGESELQQAVVEDATGRRWLVRSPLTAVAGARLQRNDELVRQLSRHVPFKVPAPAGYAAVGSEGSAAVYPHVEGMALDLTHLPAGTGLAHAVGRAIAAIHNIPPAVFENQDVPTFDAAGCRQRLVADIDRAAETGRVPTRLLARWEEAFEAAPLWRFATTPVHGAFRGSTVLVAFADDDADSGRVVAVTDWEEAMVADPAADLADLYSRAAPAAWESVLDSYALARAQRPDPYLHARARLVSETRRLAGLARAVNEGDEDAARRIVESLRRMDRLTEDEDSLVPTTARQSTAVGQEPMAVDQDDLQLETPADHVAVADDDADANADDQRGEMSGEVEDLEELKDRTVAGLAEEDHDSELADDDPGPDDVDTVPSRTGDAEDHRVPVVLGQDADVTAEVPVPPAELQLHGRDTADEQADAELEAEQVVAADDVDSASAPAADTLTDDPLADEERLHELYGMPADEHVGGGATPVSQDQGDEQRR